DSQEGYALNFPIRRLVCGVQDSVVQPPRRLHKSERVLKNLRIEWLLILLVEGAPDSPVQHHHDPENESGVAITVQISARSTSFRNGSQGASVEVPRDQ